MSESEDEARSPRVFIVLGRAAEWSPLRLRMARIELEQQFLAPIDSPLREVTTRIGLRCRRRRTAHRRGTAWLAC